MYQKFCSIFLMDLTAKLFNMQAKCTKNNILFFKFILNKFLFDDMVEIYVTLNI